MEARQDVAFETSKVYDAQLHYHLTQKDEIVGLVPGKNGKTNHAIDAYLLSSANNKYRKKFFDKLIGVSKDGTKRAEAIKIAEGLVIAQDPGSYHSPSMRRHLIKKGLADCD